jgi:hypothetical protein
MFRSLIFVLLALCASASVPAQDATPPALDPASTSAAPAEDFKSLDQEVQALKKEVLDLNRELFVLEEDLLFPANTQVAVFVSMDVGEFFALDSVTLKLDNKEVANYLYTERASRLHRQFKSRRPRTAGVVHRPGPARARLSPRRHHQADQGRRREICRAEDQRPRGQGAAGIHRQGMGVRW